MNAEIRAQIDFSWKHGDAERTAQLLKSAREADPHNPETFSEYLYSLSFLSFTQKELFREHQEYATRFEPWGFQNLAPHPDKRNGKIRIGYLSPDLYGQASHYILYPILQNHDRNRFELYIYCTHSAFDTQTELVKKEADVWRQSYHTDYKNLREQILKDEIDILVDLAGHTGVNSLPLFALRAAPIQISWFGYMNTSGLSNMDYRLSDPWRIPPEIESYYSEKIVRIPNSYTFIPVSNAPAPPPPYIKNGYITFGSLNSTYKINQDVISLWARILKASPKSRLKFFACPSPEYARWMHGIFKAHGISGTRIDLYPRMGLDDFLRSCTDIDLALDPFPYTGGVTTYHALARGIPSLTLEGTTEYERNCSAILKEAGVPEYCVSSLGTYLEKAVALGESGGALKEHRSKLSMELPSRAGSITAEVEAAFINLFQKNRSR